MARVAGVSVATVSRALRGLDRVSPETRERVLKVAQELDYVASPTATSLASGRTRVVAVVAPFLTRWFFATLVSAIEKTLRAREHHVILFDLEDDTFDQRLPLSQNMLWKRVDGVITLNVPMSTEEVDLVDRLRLPLVAIGSPVPGRACVRIDDAATMRTAVEHLAGLGHTRIGYIGAVPQNAAHIQTPQDRLEGFRDAVGERGLVCEESWILGSDWTAEAAARDSIALLSDPDRPTAIVAASDEMAIGVRESARRLGLRVPEDLSIVGVDDFVLSAVLGLTTVRQDVAGQGHRAAELLLEALLEGDLATDEVVMPIELIVRESTGPVPVRVP
ncbi:LacI family DNA-binding transcriptional regulator [Oryzobacter telluris]|uniref:LacI family DNA-binding transcriptional regulator n=1 Tax=Oryzobacter telluris TaxID=3149179 RepID=UPI00370D2982